MTQIQRGGCPQKRKSNPLFTRRTSNQKRARSNEEPRHEPPPHLAQKSGRLGSVCSDLLELPALSWLHLRMFVWFPPVFLRNDVTLGGIALFVPGGQTKQMKVHVPPQQLGCLNQLPFTKRLPGEKDGGSAHSHLTGWSKTGTYRFLLGPGFLEILPALKS